MRIYPPLVIGLMTALAHAQSSPPTRPLTAARTDDRGAKPTAPVATTADRNSAGRRPAHTVRIAPVALLRGHVPQFEFRDEPLSAVLDQIAERLRCNIAVRWSRLAEIGIQPDTPVSARGRHTNVAAMLRLTLEAAGATRGKLAFRADEEMILVSTESDFASELLTRIYDVSDLVVGDERSPAITTGRIHDVPISLQPSVAPGAVAQAPVIGRISSGLRMRVVDNGTGTGDEDEPGGPEARLTRLIDVIKSTIAPETWDVNGGPGTITVFRNRLIVRNNVFVHQEIAGPIRGPGAGNP